LENSSPVTSQYASDIEADPRIIWCIQWAHQRRGHVHDGKHQVTGITVSQEVGKAHHQNVRPATPVPRDPHQAAEVIATAGAEEMVPAINQPAMLVVEVDEVDLGHGLLLPSQVLLRSCRARWQQPAPDYASCQWV
jgi:hypothetical protein